MDESLKLDIFKVAFSICDGQPSGGPTNEEGEEEGWRGKGEEGNGREWKWGVMRRGEETELSLNEKKILNTPRFLHVSLYKCVISFTLRAVLGRRNV